MSKLEKLKERARTLEAKDTRAAIETWLEVLEAQDEEGDPNPDLGIFNRIGDLYLKVKDPGQAADYYDRAVDRYAELGFHNNAIAMCNKVLRNAPGRPTTYLKLAKLYAVKGFTGEAKQNFIQYAERMQKAGAIQQAFQALKEFADISTEGEQLREMLEEHLRAYGGPELQAKLGTASPRASSPTAASGQKTKRKTTSLVFLDLDEPAKVKAPPGRPTGVVPRPVAPPVGPPPAAPKPAPAARAPTPPPPTSKIETTSLVEEVGPEGADALAGLEPTGEDFGHVRESVSGISSIRDEDVVADAPLLAGLEPTTAPDVGAPEPADILGDLPLVSAFDVEEDADVAPEPEADVAITELPEAPPAGPPKRKTVVEIPPLELETDFDAEALETSTTEREHDVDDQPLAEEDTGWLQTETTVGSGNTPALDLGLDVVKEGEQADALVFDGLAGDSPAAPTIEELENRVADDPDDAEAHQALGEALVEAGERERGIEELDIATSGFEAAGNLAHAQGLVDEILRLDPNSVRHRQKQVEFAFKSSDKAQLIDAYLELADTLLRGDLADKARAVYERVVGARSEERARAGRPGDARSARPAARDRRRGQSRRAKDAKMTVRDETATRGRLRRPGRDDSRGRRRRAGHAHEGRGRRADRRRRDGFPRHARPVQAGHRREHRGDGLPVALRPGRGLQGDGAAGRGDRRVPEGACGRPRASCARRRRWARASSTKAPSSWPSRSCGGRSSCPPRATRSGWACCTGSRGRSKSRGRRSRRASLYGRVFAVDIRFMDVGSAGEGAGARRR